MAWAFLRGLRQRHKPSSSHARVPVVSRELRRPPPLPTSKPLIEEDAEDITGLVQLIEEDELVGSEAAAPTLRAPGSQLVLRGAQTTQRPAAIKVEAPPSRRVLFHLRRGPWSADAHLLSASSIARLRRFADALRARHEPGCTVVRVLSGLQGRDGKAPCAAQLAFALADEARRSVLLIEADVDQPALHCALDVQAPRGFGLSEQLKRMPRTAAARELRDVTRIRIGQSLDVFLEGSSVTPDLFDSPQFAALLTQSQLDYDFIVLNGPVVGSWPDTQALQGITSFLLVQNTMEAEESDDSAAITKMLQNAERLEVIDLARVL